VAGPFDAQIRVLGKQENEAVPSHSERVRRHYPPGWWEQLHDQGKESARQTNAVDGDASAEITSGAGQTASSDNLAESNAPENAVASQPVTSDSPAGTERDGAQ